MKARSLFRGWLHRFSDWFELAVSKSCKLHWSVAFLARLKAVDKMAAAFKRRFFQNSLSPQNQLPRTKQKHNVVIKTHRQKDASSVKIRTPREIRWWFGSGWSETEGWARWTEALWPRAPGWRARNTERSDALQDCQSRGSQHAPWFPGNPREEQGKACEIGMHSIVVITWWVLRVGRYWARCGDRLSIWM